MNSEEYISEKINDYIKKYSIKHHITEEEAKEHIMVKITEEYYRSGKNV